jgi:hypothetical protein
MERRLFGWIMWQLRMASRNATRKNYDCVVGVGRRMLEMSHEGIELPVGRLLAVRNGMMLFF